MRSRVAREAMLPFAFAQRALRPRVPAVAQRLRNLERRVGPLQMLAGARHLGGAQRRAVRVGGVDLFRRAIADVGAADDERRPGGLICRRRQRGIDRRRVVTVDAGDHVPAVGAETRRRVVAEPAAHVAVDRDAVVVVDHDQLAELEHTRVRAGLVRDTLHQAAVTDEHVGAMVDDLEPGPVEASRQHALGERHADGVGESLAQRAGGGFDPGGEADFRMSGRFRVELAEALQLLQRQIVAGQMQQRVQQHRAVAVRKHEAVAVGPLRMRGIVAQVFLPEHRGDVGHPHRHAGVAGFRLLDGVDGEETQCIGSGCGRGHGGGLVGPVGGGAIFTARAA